MERWEVVWENRDKEAGMDGGRAGTGKRRAAWRSEATRGLEWR